MAHPGGRPLTYSEEIINKAYAYLELCKDTYAVGTDDIPKLSRVRMPSKGGLAIHLGVGRETLYDWASKYPEFSDIMEKMGAIQEERLLDSGLSGDYNPTIAKVLLTKHGYREGQDITTNDKDLPTPIAHVQRDDSIQEDK
jgi:hypothetical protein